MVALLLFSIIANGCWAGAEILRKIKANHISGNEFFINATFWLSILYETEGLFYIINAHGHIHFHNSSIMIPMTILFSIYFIFLFISLYGYKRNDLSVQEQGDNFSVILEPVVLVLAYRVLGRISTFNSFLKWQYIFAILLAFTGANILSDFHFSKKDYDIHIIKEHIKDFIFPALFCIGELSEILAYGLFVDSGYGAEVSETEVFALFAIMHIVVIIAINVYYFFKYHHIFNPFTKGWSAYFFIALLEAGGELVYVYANEINTFVSTILTSIYPEIAIMISILFLKEKMTVKKAIALIMITIAVILAVSV